MKNKKNELIIIILLILVLVLWSHILYDRRKSIMDKYLESCVQSIYGHDPWCQVLNRCGYSCYRSNETFLGYSDGWCECGDIK